MTRQPCKVLSPTPLKENTWDSPVPRVVVKGHSAWLCFLSLHLEPFWLESVFDTVDFGCFEDTHRLLSSSFLGLPYRILNMNHKEELLRSLWVTRPEDSALRGFSEVDISRDLGSGRRDPDLVLF